MEDETSGKADEDEKDEADGDTDEEEAGMLLLLPLLPLLSPLLSAGAVRLLAGNEVDELEEEIPVFTEESDDEVDEKTGDEEEEARTVQEEAEEDSLDVAYSELNKAEALEENHSAVEEEAV